MSRLTGFFGGSPGPPINERAVPHHASPLHGHVTPGSHVYSGTAVSFNPPPREMNDVDLAYYAQNGAGVLNNNFAQVGNPPVYQPYGSVPDVFYYRGPGPYYYTQGGPSFTPQFVNNDFTQSQYVEWSSPNLASDMSPPENPTGDTNSPTPETRSSSNESIGKSRRFSRQRNVKDGDGSRPRNVSANKPHYNSVPKHEIRFSHQKKDLERKAQRQENITPSNEKEEEIANDNDARFSIIRSIGKREIDTGYDEPMSTSKETRGTPSGDKHIKKKTEKLQSSDSQLSVLLDQLTSGTYECMVCCDRVKQQHAIWNCGNCYHVFHMGCIKKWARSPAANIEDGGWRCPGCQNINKKFPSTYKCYCGKVREPEWNRRETPHSCGEVCGKKRSNNATCTHPCNILCHPGPCPPCPASVIKPCLCGKMTRKVRCSQQKPLTCTEKCGKNKNCGVHRCDVICHSGECNPCDVLVKQECFCRKDKRNVICGSEEFFTCQLEETVAVYSCGKTCERDLACGNHVCADICHKDECKLCPLLPSRVITCPCTQTKISDLTDEDGYKCERIQCCDPIPVCDKICGKPLKCGGDAVHTCKRTCHVGTCRPCEDDTSSIHCRCGKSENDVRCVEIPTELYVCDRRCNKKRKCGRHKCGKTCCTDTEHLCLQICGRKLECKLHRCEETCHRGSCPACYNVSFDELSCHCGAEVLYPPIPCGTKPPECNRQCMRQHPCFHTINHNCHNEERCPPCVVLLKKQCNCGRVMRNNIPCHQTNVSCGAPCKKVLACGHNCLKPCHQGPCMEEGDKCTQPCSIMRVECIHPCAMPCHQGKPCPSSLCKAMVTLKCRCGNREMQVECSDGGATYQRLSSEAFARQQTAKGSVDISNLFQGVGKPKVLPCDEQCTAIERNRRIAEALNIEEQSAAEADKKIYSDFLLMWARHDTAFVQGIEQELSNIIDTVAWLDKTKRSHTFPSMKREKRQVVHELAEAFNCKSVSIDEEPNRSVLVTAIRGVSKMPRVLLSDSVKKSPPKQALVKQTNLPKTIADSSAGPKRLLRSMKLVSLTSGSPSEQKSTEVSLIAKRPVSFPHMPSYPSALGKLPSSISSSKLYSGPRSERKPSSNAFASANQVDSTKSTTPLARGVNAPQRKKEPEIDYFDMTG